MPANEESATESTVAPTVLVIGGGVAGLSAAIFPARHGLATTVVAGEGSLLRRNAHLENFPGFPAGVNARLLLHMMREQAERAGATIESDRVVRLEQTPVGFSAETSDGSTHDGSIVIVATKNSVDFLDHLDGVSIVDRGKAYIETDERGRTGVEGLYAAGRITGLPHQAIVAAGHGATAAVTAIEDSAHPFYHDWVAPAGYFSDRDRDVPPGCEEIPYEEFRRRERDSMVEMREYFADPFPDAPDQHPSVSRGYGPDSA